MNGANVAAELDRLAGGLVVLDRSKIAPRPNGTQCRSTLPTARAWWARVDKRKRGARRQ